MSGRGIYVAAMACGVVSAISGIVSAVGGVSEMLKHRKKVEEVKQRKIELLEDRPEKDRTQIGRR